MKRDQLPRGFGQSPKFYDRLEAPSGAKDTWHFVVDHTPARTNVCPYPVKVIASLLHKSRQTISLHLAFYQDLGQCRLEKPRRGDSRCTRIIVCFRENDGDLLVAIDKQIAGLPEKALEKRTLGDFKAERKAKSANPKRKSIKENRGEYVA